MKETITKYQFTDWFRSSEGYKNNFSYDGLGALFDYIEELENDMGEEIEFDPIALCCEYSEYDSFEEFKERVLTLRQDCDMMISQYRDNYKKVLLTEDEYFELFSKKMNLSLDKA